MAFRIVRKENGYMKQEFHMVEKAENGAWQSLAFNSGNKISPHTKSYYSGQSYFKRIKQKNFLIYSNSSECCPPLHFHIHVNQVAGISN